MVRVTCIFLMVFSGLVIWVSCNSSEDPRRRYWGESLITHEKGNSHKLSRVLCFEDGRLCGFVNKWSTEDKYIKIDVAFETVKINHHLEIKDLSTHYNPEVRNIIPYPLEKKPLQDGKCDWSSNERLCTYSITINVFCNKCVIKDPKTPQIFNCSQRIKKEKKPIECRQMMLDLLPLEKHRITKKICAKDDLKCKDGYIHLVGYITRNK